MDQLELKRYLVKEEVYAKKTKLMFEERHAKCKWYQFNDKRLLNNSIMYWTGKIVQIGEVLHKLEKK